MICEEFSSEWLSFMDGRATPVERERLHAHFPSCEECRRRAAEYGQLWSVLEELPVVEPSLGFNARVRARMAEERRPRFFERLLPSPRLAFAIALLMALSVWFARVPADVTTAQTDDDFRMIRDLRVLEDYDVLRDFGALSEIPPPTPAVQQPAHASLNDGTM